MPRRLVPFVLVLVPLVAQGPEAPAPVRVLHAGAVPAHAPAVEVASIGPGAATLPAAPDVLVRTHGSTAAEHVVAALAALRANGCERVHFVVALPDGTPGALVLALPETAEPPATLVLRAHHERPGVPATSVVRLLRRLADGERIDAGRPFVLAIDVPANTSCAQLLPLLAAVASAGVRSAWLRTSAAAGDGDAALAFAVDGSIRAQVPPAAEPVGKPVLAAGAFGCTERPAAALPAPGGHGAGGRYGGRGGGGKAGGAGRGMWPDPRPAAPWLARIERADGLFAGDRGEPDLDGSLLWALARVGDGVTLRDGFGSEQLRGTVGWLAAAQRPDGAFEDDGDGSVRRHALATYLLAEVAGTSADGKLLMPFVDAAVRKLTALRNPDDGWSVSPGIASDARTTGWAVLALVSARFFGRQVPAEPGQLLAWFDAHPSADAAAAGIELFVRYFAGQDPKTTPARAGLADLAATLPDLADPEAVYWVSHALYQHGREHWARWSKELTALPRSRRADEWAGSWDPAPGHTRLATTALHALALEAYYRYSRLVR